MNVYRKKIVPVIGYSFKMFVSTQFAKEADGVRKFVLSDNWCTHCGWHKMWKNVIPNENIDLNLSFSNNVKNAWNKKKVYAPVGGFKVIRETKPFLYLEYQLRRYLYSIFVSIVYFLIKN